MSKFRAATAVVVLALVVVAAGQLPGPPQWPSEVQWAKNNAHRYGASVEYRLWDGTRVDYLTEGEAIEIDWAAPGKHFEAVGQALYYAAVTGKRPAIILLVKDVQADARFVYRTHVVCARAGIRLYVEQVQPVRL